MTIELFKAPDNPHSLRFIPLGGCGEFGMNMMALLYHGRLFVIDCGVRFPEPNKLGADAVIPHVDTLFESVGGVFAYMITHGHDDHIGALPYILPRWPARVYATAWTAELIKHKFTRKGLNPSNYDIAIVEAGDRVESNDISFEYVHLNHSIPMSCGLFIRTPELKVFHTGDFKLDETPVVEKPYDAKYLEKLGHEGVDLLLADSTNAEKAGQCPSEASTLEPLTKLLRQAPGAVILTTFSSNLWRLKTIADACIATGRKIFIGGTGIETTLAVGKATELYKIPDSLKVSESQLSTFPRERLTLLATGCQGEPRSVMSRLAFAEYKAFRLQKEDTVVFSSRIIPGNERAIITLIDNIRRQGAKVITTRDNPDIHVSGHGYSQDLRKLIKLLRPEHVMPVHGAFSQQLAHESLAHECGVAADKISIPQTGEVFDLTPAGIQFQGTVATAVNYVDSESGIVLSYEELRERLRVGELGAAIVTGAYAPSDGQWIVKPEIHLVGVRLTDPARTELFCNNAIHRLTKLFEKMHKDSEHDPAILAEEARVNIRRQLNQVLQKKPVVFIKLIFM